MEVNAFILYKTNEQELKPCVLEINHGEIVEFSIWDGNSMYPREYNSSLSGISKIYKTHNANRIQNGCKYYIQHSVKGEVLNIYLDISRIEYFRIKWGMREYIVQSKEFIVALSIGIILLVLGLILN